MVTALSAETPTGLRDRAILVLGFALMGRRSESTEVEISDLTITEDGLEVYIPLSKTDQDAHGETVAIPYGSHASTCPLRVVRAWLTALAEDGITTGALFRPIDRHGRIGDRARSTAGRGQRARLSPQAVNLIVKQAARAAGLDHAENYTAHGLRAGGATSAAKAGAPMSAITRHGRWSEGSPPATTRRAPAGTSAPTPTSPANSRARAASASTTSRPPRSAAATARPPPPDTGRCAASTGIALPADERGACETARPPPVGEHLVAGPEC